MQNIKPNEAKPFPGIDDKYNKRLNEPWEGRIDKARIASVAIGKLKQQLPQVAKANSYKVPDQPFTNFRYWHKKLDKKVLAKLPKLSPNPLDGQGKITSDELSKIKAWLKQLPPPRSNTGLLNITWGYEGVMRKTLSGYLSKNFLLLYSVRTPPPSKQPEIPMALPKAISASLQMIQSFWNFYLRVTTETKKHQWSGVIIWMR